MSTLTAILLLAGGLALLLYSAEKLVAGAAGTARGFGLSAFVVGVVFLGFDPENLALGAVAGYEGVPGIALGSILGAAMVAIAMALGVTALIAPMELRPAPLTVVSLPVAAVALFGLLALDGRLSRLDGAVLLGAYPAAIACVFALSRRGVTIEPREEKELEEAERLGRWRAAGLLVLALAAIVTGSELIVRASESLLERFGISETFYGMTVLAFLVSIEEVARELPAALRGRPEISLGNVVGSVFAFFLMNAGIIALVRPVPVAREVLVFHLPAVLLITVLIAALLRAGRVPRWAGALLLALYLGFLAGSWVLEGP
ncbi:MAG TPA: sodium:calcium antiporter [Thermoanaerobaculia bacterium]|nr:sodium:calcium antiporter [Thermoanaerobaculia bacterium]